MGPTLVANKGDWELAPTEQGKGPLMSSWMFFPGVFECSSTIATVKLGEKMALQGGQIRNLN